MRRLTLENTAIVVDSTCDPPPGYYDRPGLAMVPLKVNFGDETYRDGVDLSPPEFFAKLASSPVLPTTSQPTVGEFTAVYAELTRGYEQVFAFHLSSTMSGTYQASLAAAQPYGGVEVYDTRTVSATITLLVERLRTRLAAGVSRDEAHAYIEHFLRGNRMLFQVPTLEYLRRGGRIGRAQSMVGDVFGIRPIITIDDGELVAYAKVRGERRALEAMTGMLRERTAPDDAVKLITWSSDADDKLPALEEALLAVRPGADVVLHGRVGAVVGTHGGPGMIAFAMIVE
jgi:DegV family protein with EDD domain